ncbi:NifB/NifX family molybdenum-iron cluster-binding protein [Treponema primitia]|uniref:NifB/NifX family molybdenum-iron cluster-binding protein n=1 Tax=Treponema primitia TaxID=88058 RepID=UPI00025554CC|nr:NifB/NifX family molybdenum-iron cluster-binding protein [Treponema primitia]
MPYKIALTTSNGSDVDLHFGQSTEFQVFQVHEDTGTWEFLEQRNLNRATGPACAPGECPDTSQASCAPGCAAPSQAASCGGCGSGQGHRDERIEAVIAVLSDCNYILTAKIGPKPQAVLKQAGITALESPTDLGVAIGKLNTYHNKYNKITRF